MKQLFYPNRSRFVAKASRLLKHLRQLPGGAQQIELRLLAGKIRIEERQPLLVFVKLRGFQIAQLARPC